ncbi:Hypothetical protein A7982_01337 [Minicystis rosea]|nr:Hypothetical protein A7982_01337 [Minicystis rosea]
MSVVHVVEQGECLTTIAHRYGFGDWHAIYDHADNAKLRKKRPDPDLLFPGDTIVIPDRAAKEIEVATDRVHRFKVKRGARRLRVHILDIERKLHAGKPYKLFIDDAVHSEASTGGDGEIDVLIPVDARKGRIEIEDHAWDLDLGHLNPVAHAPDEGSSGIKARLHNLGYDVGRIEDPIGPELRGAIRWFQRDHGLDPSGDLDDATRAEILRAHRS